MHPLQSLLRTGTKLYLDSVDPTEIDRNLGWGAAGATSNPAIVSDIISRGVCDAEIAKYIARNLDDETIAWTVTDHLVHAAEEQFLPIWKSTGGNEGWVSFELDPLIECPTAALTIDEQQDRYVHLGTRWAKDHPNRMIKVPATPGGIAALEELAARGVALNVTLIFTQEQYQQARDAVWRGAQRRSDLEGFKSVYSVFVSRIDLYTEHFVPTLSSAAQGLVGILNARRIWQDNSLFWKNHSTRLEQEIIFASTGTKKPTDPPWKYVAALAGAGIQTNPPQTNLSIADSDIHFTRTVDQWPPASVIEEIESKVDFRALHAQLMREGIEKFIQPQLALLKLIAERRRANP